MAKGGRNRPCPCRSGRKAKRCCGTTTGPAPEERARAWLRVEGRRWAPQLADLDDDELDALAEDVLDLPRRDLSLHLQLPRVLPPALERLRAACADQDQEAVEAVGLEALAVVDTPLGRAHLARGVLALHDHGHRIDCDLTALAIVDLARSERSIVVLASLVHTLAVAAGAGRTPGGLVLASR